jgi:hypothetical protein
MALTREQRATAGRLGAHIRWAKESDPKAATAPARKGFMARFEKQVDPDGVLAPEERTRRAKHARQAYMTALALKSSIARAKPRTA